MKANLKQTSQKIRACVALALLFTSSAVFSFYDSAAQRWVNRDPIEEEGGINPYTYVDNSPQNAFDPLGWQSSGGTAGSTTPEYWEIMRWIASEEGKKCAVQVGIGVAGAGATLSSCQCKRNPKDPCQHYLHLRSRIPQAIRVAVSTVSLAGGSQADLDKIPGLTDELKKLIADMYDAAADCAQKKGRSGSHNRERARFLRGERSDGPGGNRPPLTNQE